jgi:hypothetical protein
MTEKMSAAEIAARRNIPQSALDTMVPYDARGDLGAYSFVHSPCGAIPTDYSKQQVGRTTARAPGDGTGWQREIPISNPPSTVQCDKLMDAADARGRAAAETQQGGDFMTQAMQMVAMMLQQQHEMLKLVVAQEK